MAKMTTDQKIDLVIEEMKSQHKTLELLQKEFVLQRSDIKSLKNNVGDLRKDVGSVRNDIKNVKLDIGSLKTDVTGLKVSTKSLGQDIRDLRKEMYEQFDSWDQKFFEFKSQIHDLIDNGFSSKAKEHDEAIEILNVRTTEIRANVEKLNNVVFPG